MPPVGPVKGRGATLSPAVRFEHLRREAFDDGWGTADELAEAPSPRTELLPDASRPGIATNDSPLPRPGGDRAQRLPRPPVRPVDHPFPGLRARLRLLLRAAKPRLPRLLA